MVVMMVMVVMSVRGLKIHVAVLLVAMLSCLLQLDRDVSDAVLGKLLSHRVLDGMTIAFSGCYHV